MAIGDNIRKARLEKGINQKTLAELISIPEEIVSNTTISNWENGISKPDADTIARICKVLDVDANFILDFESLNFDNATPIDIKPTEMVKIPVLGKIPAGMPMEAIEEQYTINYEEIPKSWLTGGREYFALILDGDSMEPDYHDKDIAIFLKSVDCESGQDCCVRINGFEATFKRIKKQENGIMIIPLNENNSTGFNSKFYTNEDITNMPIEIVGIIKQIRRNK